MSMSQTAEWIDKSESECSTSVKSSHQVEPTGLFRPQVTMSNVSTNACMSASVLVQHTLY